MKIIKKTSQLTLALPLARESERFMTMRYYSTAPGWKPLFLLVTCLSAMQAIPHACRNSRLVSCKPTKRIAVYITFPTITSSLDDKAYTTAKIELGRVSSCPNHPHPCYDQQAYVWCDSQTYIYILFVHACAPSQASRYGFSAPVIGSHIHNSYIYHRYH